MAFDNLINIETFDNATALTFDHGETQTRVWVSRRVEVAENAGAAAIVGTQSEIFDQPEQLPLFDDFS